MRRNTLAASTTNTATFVIPSIGGSVSVGVASAAAYNPIGTYGNQPVYVYGAGYTSPDIYTVTLASGLFMTIQLVSLGSGAVGNTMAVGSTLANPGQVTVIVAGTYSRGE